MEKKWTPPCIILIVQYEYWLLMNQDNSNEGHVSGDLEKLIIYKIPHQNQQRERQRYLHFFCKGNNDHNHTQDNFVSNNPKAIHTKCG